jgi:hypothetical protein
MHALRLARALRPARALVPTRALSASAAPRAARPPPLADDPYPLPFTSSHVAPAGQSDAPGAAPHEPELDLADPALPFPTPLSRAGESVETLRARLVYQTRKRGTLESDLLMSTFASEEMGAMDEGELREFDRVRAVSFPCPLAPHPPRAAPLRLGCVGLSADAAPRSCSTRTTGTCTTGSRARRRRRRAGRARRCLRASRSTRATRARSRGACLRSEPRAATRECTARAQAALNVPQLSVCDRAGDVHRSVSPPCDHGWDHARHACANVDGQQAAAQG